MKDVEKIVFYQLLDTCGPMSLKYLWQGNLYKGEGALLFVQLSINPPI